MTLIVMLHRENDTQTGIRLQTQYWNSSTLVAIITEEQIDYIDNGGASLLVRVTASNGTPVTHFKRVWTNPSTTTLAKIRPNAFSHSWGDAKHWGDIYDGNKRPGEYVWNDNERFDVDLYSYPAHGGPQPNNSAFQIPNLERWTQSPRAEWHIKFLPHGQTDIPENWLAEHLLSPRSMNGQSFPMNQWRQEGMSIFGPKREKNYQAVFMDNTAVQNLGGYPGCYSKAQIRTTIITPADDGLFTDPVNLCGPFDVNWKTQIPYPTVNITASLAEVPAMPGARQLNVNGEIPPRFTERGTLGTCQWHIRYKPVGYYGAWSEWQAVTALNGLVGAIPLTVPPIGEFLVEARSRCQITPAGPILTCTAQAEGFSNTVSLSPTATSSIPTPIEERTLSTVPNTFNLMCSPNPASSYTTISYTLPHDATASLEITDALQRTIMSVCTHEEQTEGTHSFLVPTTSLANGTYTVHLITRLNNGQMNRTSRHIIILR